MKFGQLMLTSASVLIAQPTVACSGLGPQGHAVVADVIISGQLIDNDGDADELVTKKVIKGTHSARYKVVWSGSSRDDECGFLSPVFRDNGVYFLKHLENGNYLISWTEKRWNRRWGNRF